MFIESPWRHFHSYFIGEKKAQKTKAQKTGLRPDLNALDTFSLATLHLEASCLTLKRLTGVLSQFLRLIIPQQWSNPGKATPGGWGVGEEKSVN